MREDDVSEVIRDFATTPRMEFETAFPDLGSLLTAIDTRAYRRSIDEQREARQVEAERLEKDRREHPENYVSYEKILSDFKASRASKQ